MVHLCNLILGSIHGEWQREYYIPSIHYYKVLLKWLFLCLPGRVADTHTRIIILFCYTQTSSHIIKCLVYFLNWDSQRTRTYFSSVQCLPSTRKDLSQHW